MTVWGGNQSITSVPKAIPSHGEFLGVVKLELLAFALLISSEESCCRWVDLAHKILLICQCFRSDRGMCIYMDSSSKYDISIVLNTLKGYQRGFIPVLTLHREAVLKNMHSVH